MSIAKTLEKFRENRQRLIDGKVNSIPSPFKKSFTAFPGLIPQKYIILTGHTKSSKTQFASFFYLYNTILYCYDNPKVKRIKVFYYNLEESEERINARFCAFLLFKLSKGSIIVSPSDLLGDNNQKIPAWILDRLEDGEYRKILDFWDECVTFTDRADADSLYFELQNYCKENGKLIKETIHYKNEFGEDDTYEKTVGYEHNDPECIRMIFFDHFSKVTLKKGKDLRQSMIDMSNRFMRLRDVYGFTIVAIQQQTLSIGLDNISEDKVKASISALGDKHSKFH